jgi:TonB family protein
MRPAVRASWSVALVAGMLATSASGQTPRHAVCACIAPSCQFDAPVGSGWIFEPKLLSRLPPPPRDSTATVILDIRIDERGRVTHACVVRGLDPEIDAEAITIVKRWRYIPAALAHPEGGHPTGTPIPIAITVAVAVRPEHSAPSTQHSPVDSQHIEQ